ncbi:MAG TPA: glycosyltransferase family 39 protein [Planctomycetota bacterium]|nr:glycosyltransferase family 39 protein [Planctomycetota bacterium]
MPTSPPTPVPARILAAPRALPFLLLLASALPYLPLLGGELVGDGRALVQGHETLRTATRGAGHFARLFAEDYWDGLAPASGLYRPVTTGLLGLVFTAAGERASVYRALAILFHGAVVLGAWRLARRLLPPARAAAAAALFAVHPVHSEAVGDVANLGEMLATLLSILVLERLLARKDGAPVGAPALDGALFLLGLLAKESAAALLLVAPLALVLLPSSAPPRRILRALLPLLLAFLADLALRRAALGFLLPRYLPTNRIENPLIFEPAAVRLPTAARVLVHGLGLLVLPWHLSADHSLEDFRLSRSPLEPAVLGSAFVLAGMVVAGALLRRRSPGASLGFLGCLASFAPTSNLLFPAGTIFAERHLLLPSFFFAVATTALAPGSRRTARALVAGFGALLFLFGARTAARSLEWRSAAALTEVTARRDSPRSVRLRYNLAAERRKAGDLPGARDELERALSIYPDFYQARTSLGLVLLSLDDLEGGVRELRRALREWPASYPGASWKEGASALTHTLARRLGRGGEAVQYWRELASEHSASPDVRVELAYALDLGGLPGSEEQLRLAAERSTGARILFSQRLPPEEAVRVLRAPLPPGTGWDAQAQLLFAEGQALHALDRFGEAEETFGRARSTASNRSIAAAAVAGIALTRLEEAKEKGAPLREAILEVEAAARDPKLPGPLREEVLRLLGEVRRGTSGAGLPRRP